VFAPDIAEIFNSRRPAMPRPACYSQINPALGFFLGMFPAESAAENQSHANTEQSQLLHTQILPCANHPKVPETSAD
jgi:hypothetical protein